jgi:RNA-binding protein
MPLSGNQRRFLRALGHHLSPVVQVGNAGATAGVVAALQVALHDHELVKVKFGQSVEDRETLADSLAASTGSELAQVLGRTALLYKPREQKPKIVLPAPRRKPEGG